MGIYDPSKDTATTTNVNSRPFSDPIYNALSKTNELTLNSIDALKNVFTRDFSSDYNRLNDIFGKLAGAANLLTTDSIIRLPNELVTETVPPLDAFEECNKLNGLGVWDQKGLWHCLFPRAVIPYHYEDGTIIDDDDAFTTVSGNLISKEDIENDFNHQNGVWFSSLQDLLTWQSQMKKVIKAKNDQQWKNWKEKESKKWSSLWDSDNSENDGADSKRVVSRQMESRMRSIDSGDLERITIEKRTYNDGTKTQWEKTEILDPNGEVKSVNEKNL